MNTHAIAVRTGFSVAAVRFAFAVLALAAAFTLPGAARADALSTVEAYVGAWNAHDAAKAADYFADDVVS